MLPSDLLRARIYRGRMTPLLCATQPDSGPDHTLAQTLLTYFADSQKTHTSKGRLMHKIGLLEPDGDYKLIRGLSTLLERRSTFARVRTKTLSPGTAPAAIRRSLFSESARRGLALSDSQRQDIMQTIACQMHTPPGELETAMWSDMEDNLILEEFSPISPSDLLFWYNLSLVQTLLFKCTRLEFHIEGGMHWKRVLRNVKRFGLMYSLQYTATNDTNTAASRKNNATHDDSITCTLEGPLSIFKMTDKYGTAMAKILPSIIQTPSWKISGLITRRANDAQKVYSFELSSDDTGGFIRQVTDSNCKQLYSTGTGKTAYDSSVEEAFAQRFMQHFDPRDKSNWKILREPDPLIANGKAMIPDFVFERFGRKVYMEIVGFWTADYLKRKADKLKTLFNNGAQDSQKGIDMLVAVDRNLACSQTDAVPPGRIFTYKDNVPLKPILDRLKEIDAQIVQEKTDSEIRIEISRYDPDIILVSKITSDYNIPEPAALQIIDRNHPNTYTKIESHIISNTKISTVRDALDTVTDFVQACKIMSSHDIPDSCHAAMLSNLDYDVSWPDLNPANAKITKSKKACK